VPAAFGGDQVQVLGLASAPGGTAALMAAGSSLLAAWSGATGWAVSAPVAAGVVVASGFGPAGSVWVLLGGGRAEAIGGAGGSWRALPAVPAGTQALAPGPGGGYDALAVSGSRLTVWRLGPAAAARASWARIQVIDVPIEYGSSS
jgi:hypothetical protein